MKKKFVTMLMVLCGIVCIGGCGNENEQVKTTTEFKETQTTATVETTATTSNVDNGNSSNSDGLTDGTYNISVESDSAMFKVEKAELTVAERKMTATITLSGTGYTKLFMGTAELATTAKEEDIVPYIEDAEGKYRFIIPVEVLDEAIDCAAFSQKKEQWYARQLTFSSASIAPLEDKTAEIKDGTYTIELTFEGGSGKAQILSPATLTVKDGKATATVQWNSSNYDYMIVNGEKYLAVNNEGNSSFEIPVMFFDEAINIIGNTVAMSKPREIEYTLNFHSDTIKSAK